MRSICYHDFLKGQLTDLPLESYSTLYKVACRNQWLTVLH